MRINQVSNFNQQNNTKFQGIYRIPNSAKNIADIEQHVAPMYSYLRHEPVIGLLGSNPFKIGVDMIMDIIAENNHSSVSWVKMNAKNHGADLSNLDDRLLIVSGKKDIEGLANYMRNRVAKKTNFFAKVKTMFSRSNEAYADKPNHLKPLFKVLQENKEENAAFVQEYGAQIVDVKTPQELLAKMLCER